MQEKSTDRKKKVQNEKNRKIEAFTNYSLDYLSRKLNENDEKGREKEAKDTHAFIHDW